MRCGFRVQVENIALLTQEQRQDLRRKLGVLAVSTRGLFADPVQVTGPHMTAHYSDELYAQETVHHLYRYLQQISMESKVKVTLHPAQWQRIEELNSPPD